MPRLAYNLLSVTSASRRGKVTTFFELHCEIRDTKSKVVACGYREGSLYLLDHEVPVHQAHTVVTGVSPRPVFGIAGLVIWVFKVYKHWQRTEWSKVWIMTGSEKLDSVNPV